MLLAIGLLVTTAYAPTRPAAPEIPSQPAPAPAGAPDPGRAAPDRAPGA
ncbi:hypothetical protein ACQP00_39630 [Dactylosporangium sp. CS-047395]